MAVVMYPVLKVHLQTLLLLLLLKEMQWAGKEMQNHQVEKMKRDEEFLPTVITWRLCEGAVGEGRCLRGRVLILALAVSVAEDSSKGVCFLFRNSSRRLAFLLRVDGFGFFLTGSFPLVSKEGEVSRAKAKLEPTVRENLKAKPWLDSVWQRFRGQKEFIFTHCSHFGILLN